MLWSIKILYLYLIIKLETKCRNVEECFKTDGVIVQHDKFQVILLNKKCCDFTNIDLNVYNQTTKLTTFVEFLEIKLHDKWNFDLHITAAKQLILKFLNFYLVSNINHRRLVLMFWVLNIWKNISNVQERELTILI